jgi:hypothetical protein
MLPIESVPMRPAKKIDDIVLLSALERRRTPRRRVHHIGMILNGSGAEPHYCLVIEMSDGGVRLRTIPGFEAPNEFVLRFGGTEAEYKVSWRNGSLLGAELMAAPKSALALPEAVVG